MAKYMYVQSCKKILSRNLNELLKVNYINILFLPNTYDVNIDLLFIIGSIDMCPSVYCSTKTFKCHIVCLFRK